jgi:hypothetical protein
MTDKEKKAAGRCYTCTEDATPGHTRCDKCAADAARRNKESRARKHAGLSSDVGEFRLDPISGEMELWTPEDLALEHAPRCPKCRLMLPHDNCPVDTVDETATRRR